MATATCDDEVVMNIYDLNFLDAVSMCQEYRIRGECVGSMYEIVRQLLLNDVKLLDELAERLRGVETVGMGTGIYGSRNRWHIPLFSVLLSELSRNPQPPEIEYAIVTNFKTLVCGITRSPNKLFINVVDSGFKLLNKIRGTSCENSSK